MTWTSDYDRAEGGAPEDTDTEHGVCEDCEAEGDVYDLGHSILCEGCCADDSAEHGAWAWEDRKLRRGESGYPDA